MQNSDNNEPYITEEDNTIEDVDDIHLANKYMSGGAKKTTPDTDDMPQPEQLDIEIKTYTPRENFNLYLSFIDPSDEKLVDVDKVVIYADRYLATYNSTEMQNYRSLYKIIWQKYNNKKNIVTNTAKNLTVVSRSSGDTIINIKKPLYTNVLDEIRVLTEQRKTIKDILDYEYDKLIRIKDNNDNNVEAADKIKVENMKGQYIELLQKLYIYKLYYAKINNILNNDSEKMIVIQNIRPSFKDGAPDDARPILDAKSYRLSKSLIGEINNVNSEKLEMYNNIKMNLQVLSGQNSTKEQQKELKSMIIQYLDTGKKDINDAQINAAVKVQDNEISELILELPEFDKASMTLV